jgi:hypothetical protein
LYAKINDVMEPNISKLPKELLKLPPDVRAALAGSHLESLDETVDPNLEAAWEAEIATRLKELDFSDLKTIPWSEARRSIVSKAC